MVVIHLAPSADGGTVLTLSHHGFGTVGRWEDVQAYFDVAWGEVIEALGAKFPVPPAPALKKRK